MAEDRPIEYPKNFASQQLDAFNAEQGRGRDGGTVLPPAPEAVPQTEEDLRGIAKRYYDQWGEVPAGMEKYLDRQPGELPTPQREVQTILPRGAAPPVDPTDFVAVDFVLGEIQTDAGVKIPLPPQVAEHFKEMCFKVLLLWNNQKMSEMAKQLGVNMEAVVESLKPKEAPDGAKE